MPELNNKKLKEIKSLIPSTSASASTPASPIPSYTSHISSSALPSASPSVSTTSSSLYSLNTSSSSSSTDSIAKQSSINNINGTKSSIRIINKTTKAAFESLIKYINFKKDKKDFITLSNLYEWRKNHKKAPERFTNVIEQTMDIEITYALLPSIIDYYIDNLSSSTEEKKKATTAIDFIKSRPDDQTTISFGKKIHKETRKDETYQKSTETIDLVKSSMNITKTINTEETTNKSTEQGRTYQNPNNTMNPERSSMDCTMTANAGETDIGLNKQGGTYRNPNDTVNKKGETYRNPNDTVYKQGGTYRNPNDTVYKQDGTYRNPNDTVNMEEPSSTNKSIQSGSLSLNEPDISKFKTNQMFVDTAKPQRSPVAEKALQSKTSKETSENYDDPKSVVTQKPINNMEVHHRLLNYYGITSTEFESILSMVSNANTLDMNPKTSDMNVDPVLKETSNNTVGIDHVESPRSVSKKEKPPQILYTNLFDKAQRIANHIRVLIIHISAGTTPKALDRKCFPVPLLNKDERLTEKINNIIKETQKNIITTTLEHLKEKKIQLDNEMIKLQDKLSASELNYIHQFIKKEQEASSIKALEKCEKRIIRSNNAEQLTKSLKRSVSFNLPETKNSPETKKKLSNPKLTNNKDTSITAPKIKKHTQTWNTPSKSPKKTSSGPSTPVYINKNTKTPVKTNQKQASKHHHPTTDKSKNGGPYRKNPTRNTTKKAYQSNPSRPRTPNQFKNTWNPPKNMISPTTSHHNTWNPPKNMISPTTSHHNTWNPPKNLISPATSHHNTWNPPKNLISPATSYHDNLNMEEKHWYTTTPMHRQRTVPMSNIQYHEPYEYPRQMEPFNYYRTITNRLRMPEQLPRPSQEGFYLTEPPFYQVQNRMSYH